MAKWKDEWLEEGAAYEELSEAELDKLIRRWADKKAGGNGTELINLEDYTLKDKLIDGKPADYIVEQQRAVEAWASIGVQPPAKRHAPRSEQASQAYDESLEDQWNNPLKAQPTGIRKREMSKAERESFEFAAFGKEPPEPRQAQALRLKNSGLTYRQVAAEMGISIGAAKAHVSAARKGV